MVGSFENKDKCIAELKNQCFIFYTAIAGITYYYSKSKQEIAEINIYKDGSASALIGKYKI